MRRLVLGRPRMAWIWLSTASLFAAVVVAAAAANPSPQSARESPRKNSSRKEASVSALAAPAMALLRAECVACHNEEKKKGGLLLISREAVLAGSGNGPVVTLDRPGRSRLLSVLEAGADPHMPPKRQLGTAEIAVIKDWIQAGIPWDSISLTGPVARTSAVAVRPPPAGHEPVLAAALAPDGKRFASGRGVHLMVYDVLSTNGSPIAQLTAHHDLVRSVAWSSDAPWLASGGFRELILWDAKEMTPVRIMRQGFADRIEALAFLAGTGMLAVADGDGSSGQPGLVRLISIGTGEVEFSWRAHAGTIHCLQVSGNGKWLATAGADKIARIWSIDELVAAARRLPRGSSGTLRARSSFEGHAGGILGAAFNAEGTWLATAGVDKQLKVWSVETGENVLTLGTHRHGLTALVWTPKSNELICADEIGIITSYKDFKLHTGEQSSGGATEQVVARVGIGVNSLVSAPTGERIVAGGVDGSIRWLGRDGKLAASSGPPDGRGRVSSKDPIARAPSFLRDVLPVLTKAGCNSGSCHAKGDGQAGFKLTVFNYDPLADYREMVHDMHGRRVLPGAPEESLVLLKPAGLMDHGGGRRFEPGSDSYRVVAQWIRSGMAYEHQGAPTLQRIEVSPREGIYASNAKQALRVHAIYGDGSREDVTALADFISSDPEIVHVDGLGLATAGSGSGEAAVVARFMGRVDAARITIPAAAHAEAQPRFEFPANNFIDELAVTQWRKLRLIPSELCTDAEFARRSSLDAVGGLPEPGVVRKFLADPAPNRRERWIEELLALPAYAGHWANKWTDLLRPNPDRVGIKSVYVLDQWLRSCFASNMPYDRFARALMESEGSNHKPGPMTVYRDRREPAELATLFSQTFLGVRMECAKCHHHPNEKWSQDDFYQFAAFFGSLKQKGAGLSPPISAGIESFYYAPGGVVRHPVTDAIMQPRPLEGMPLAAKKDRDPRSELADWMTHPDNPHFSRAVVNRIWAAYFGRGFVEPVDDFRVSNPASQEMLLAALARDFVSHGYDLKHLMRTIMRSRLYQLSSTPDPQNLADTKNFSRSYRRRLPAEVLLDAVCDVTGVPESFQGLPAGSRANEAWTFKIPSHFMDAFGRPNSSSDCPCERDGRGSVTQSLHLMHAKGLQEKLTHTDGRARQLASSAKSSEEIVEELYFTALGRPPAAAELSAASATFAAPGATRQTATEDVLWALLNGAEFVFNH